MEAVIKLMLMTRNVQCETGFTGKGKEILKPCVYSLCQWLLEDFASNFLMVQICISAQTMGMEASSSTETPVLFNTAVRSSNSGHLNISCVA